MLSQAQHTLALARRKDYRNVIFQLNRQNIATIRQQQHQNQLDDHEGVISTNSISDYMDPNHKNIIQTFKNVSQKREDLLELIRLLKEGNWIIKYKAVIGIFKFEGKIFNSENQDQILGTGIVPALAKLLSYSDHPYLQLYSTAILTRMLLKLSRERIQAFFNRTTIPINFLVNCLNSPQGIVVINMVTLITRLKNRNYCFEQNDNSADLISIIDKLADRWRQSSEKLSGLARLTVLFKVKFSRDTLIFSQKMFALMNKFISYSTNLPAKSDTVRSVIYWLSDGHFVRRIKRQIETSLERFQTKHPKMVFLLNTIYFFDLEANYLDSNMWAQVICPLIINLEGSRLMKQFNVLGKIEEKLMRKNQPQHVIMAVVKVFNTLIRSSEQTVGEIMAKEHIFEEIKNLYSQNSRGSLKVLNSTTIQMLKKVSVNNNLLDIVIKYKLLHLYINQTHHQTCASQKKTFSDLKKVLVKLKDSPQLSDQYNRVLQVLAEENNIKAIRQTLQNNYLNGCSTLLEYFQAIIRRDGDSSQMRMRNRQIQIIDLIQDVSSVINLTGGSDPLPS